MIRRWMRLLLGMVAAGLALYVILGEQFAGTSANAVINAQVLILRAPIDGQVALAVHALGARIGEKEHIATIADPRPDDSRLLDLRRLASLVAIDLHRLKDRATALEEARAGYRKQADAYMDGRIRQIEARIAEANSAMEAAQARLRDSEAAFRRATELGRSGFQSQAELTRSRSTAEVGAQDVQAARDRIRYLTVELEAARQGIFLGEANNDAPHSEQRIRDIGLQLAETAADIEERTQRLRSLRNQIDEEALRLGRFSEARIDSPVPGILWEIMSGRGEYVRKAQDVVRLVDCTSTIITASVREAIYNHLQVGDPVQFRLLGDDRTFEGTIARLAGSGAQSIYRSLAVGPSEEHLKRFDVMVLVPGLKADPALACAIGRTGRVTFSAGPLQFWRRWLATLGLA